MNEEERRKLDRELRKMMEMRNNQSDPNREGLSPLEIHRLIRSPLAEESWFGLREQISDDTILKMPLILLAVAMLERIAAQKEIKLTAKGNLPRKLVQELFALTDYRDDSFFEPKIPMSEEDWPTIGEVHFIVRNIGWCKKKHNKISLTAKGKKVLTGPRRALFEQYLHYHMFKVELGWRDGYPPSAAIQSCFPYTLFLLYKYGRQTRSDRQYAENFLRAFPMSIENFEPDKYSSPEELFLRAYCIRCFKRFALAYGWIDYRTVNMFAADDFEATDLFYEIFEQREAKDLPTPADHVDKEIETALFDAEMGSISHFSDDIPLEVMQSFHDQVRAFHANDPQEEVVIRALLPADFPLLPPEEVVEEDVAKREISRVLAALEAANISTEPPGHLSAVDYYDFLYRVILPAPIILFGDNMNMHLPYEYFLDEEEEVFGPEMEITEAFLLCLFRLDHPFPEQLLAGQVRLGPDMVAREVALAHLNTWRAQFREIIPLSFAPGPIEEDDSGCVFPTFMVAYKTITTEGKEEELEGIGVVQLNYDQEVMGVQGAQFPGFEF